MVAKGDDLLELPEDGPSVAVVVIAERDVLDTALTFLQDGLDVLEEPRLVPARENLNLSIIARLLSKRRRHDHHFV